MDVARTLLYKLFRGLITKVRFLKVQNNFHNLLCDTKQNAKNTAHKHKARAQFIIKGLKEKLNNRWDFCNLRVRAGGWSVGTESYYGIGAMTKMRKGTFTHSATTLTDLLSIT